VLLGRENRELGSDIGIKLFQPRSRQQTRSVFTVSRVASCGQSAGTHAVNLAGHSSEVRPGTNGTNAELAESVSHPCERVMPGLPLRRRWEICVGRKRTTSVSLKP